MREVALGDLVKFQMGGTPPREEPMFWATSGNGFPWVSISDMQGREISTTAEQITESGIQAARLKMVPAGTPIMSFKLTIGRCAIPAIDCYTNEAIVALHARPHVACSSWLFHAVPRAVSSAVTETAVKGQTLNLKKLAGIKIVVPNSLAEQHRIAEILNSVDGVTETTEKLVDKLRLLKQGLADDLLSGRVPVARSAEALADL
ncbi:MAG: restriction endonuclease subunit S [Gemmatimonadota bacterium]|jgi:type I restriction enzyme S subunit|nr:restriction endonuclease subunit S [Gemmatimonadota bacterium]